MKRQIALILSALLCILSACGGMGTDAPELDLPEADVIESEPVAALGEYSRGRERRVPRRGGR